VQKRNFEPYYHIEWESILVNTWGPVKHLESDDGRADFAAWELQCAQVPAVRFALY
jgi:hypothetical protein